MNYVEIDGKPYDVIVSSIQRSPEIRQSENAGATLAEGAEETLDPLGTFITYIVGFTRKQGKEIEFDKQENRRTHMFYCNPSAPYQKGNCENNHEMIRRCIPKGIDLGQYTQEQINLMMSHINSYARPKLGNKSPYDVFAFQYGEDILSVLGIKRIPADEIILTPKIFE